MRLSGGVVLGSGWRLGLVAALGVGILGTISIAGDGPGLGPDSAEYIAGARSIAAGDGYLGRGGGPATAFPPGFPLLLAVGVWLGFDAVAVAGWANLALVAGSAFITSLIVDRVVSSKSVKWFAVGLIVFSAAILARGTSVGSEALFIFLAISSLAVLAGAMSTPGPFLLAGVLAGLASATRYIGVTVVAAGVVWIWFCHKQNKLRAIFWYAAPAALLVLSSGTIWQLAVRRQDTYPAANSIFTNLKYLAASIEGFFVPRAVPLTVGTLLVAAIGGFLTWRAIKYRVWIRPTPPVSLFASFIGVYLVVLLTLEMIVNIDPPTVRFLSPIYLPAIIVGSYAFERIQESESETAMKRGAWFAGLALLAGAVLATGNLVIRNVTTSPWPNDSPTVAVVETNRQAWESEFPQIFSNDPWVTYLQTGLVVELTAKKTQRLSNEPGMPREAMCPEASQKTLLIWYENGIRTHHYTLEEIGRVCRVQPIIETDDGGAYALSPR